jgi:hypothetical protein
MTKGMFALLLAGALMVPHMTPAFGTESTVGIAGPRHAPPLLASGGALQLPPIPHLETLRWLDSGSRGPKVDTLLSPRLDTFGPFLVRPEIPSATFSSIE